MDKYLLLLFLAAAVFFAGCKKEDVSVFTPIYSSGNQEYGWGRGLKNGMEFESSGLAVRHQGMPDVFFGIRFLTYTDWGAERESITIGEVGYVLGRHLLVREDDNQQNGVPDAKYNTSSDDGDVQEDRYCLDVAKDNWIEISFIDTLNGELTVSGKYNLHFLVDGEKQNPMNPDKVNFTEGVFEVKFSR